MRVEFECYSKIVSDSGPFWYEPDEVLALTSKYGLVAKFVPSELYPCRTYFKAAPFYKLGTIPLTYGLLSVGSRSFHCDA
ncbi:MAG TPA: hypothetical protein VFE02_18380 [Candidatus Acidoferrales bacterium]|nr:hypothetical protein [Candidatus Acidoferrales bacterium]